MFCYMELCGKNIGRGKDEHLYLSGSRYNNRGISNHIKGASDMDFGCRHGINDCRAVYLGIYPAEQKISMSYIRRSKIMDLQNEKCVMVIDEQLPLGLIANTAAIMGITLGKEMQGISRKLEKGCMSRNMNVSAH